MRKSYSTAVADPTWDALDKQYTDVKHVVINLARRAKQNTWSDVSVFTHWCHLTIREDNHPSPALAARYIVQELAHIFGTVDDIPQFTSYGPGAESLVTQVGAVIGLDGKRVALFELRVGLNFVFPDDKLDADERKQFRLDTDQSLISSNILAAHILEVD